ncbi:hypothetical protein YC2023_019600 [Brassica napus]
MATRHNSPTSKLIVDLARDKNQYERKEYNHTYFTFLSQNAISLGYAFQSDKSSFEFENIIILFPLEYSRSIDFWSTIII